MKIRNIFIILLFTFSMYFSFGQVHANTSDESEKVVVLTEEMTLPSSESKQSKPLIQFSNSDIATLLFFASALFYIGIVLFRKKYRVEEK